jgi:hypothetical protein
MDAEAWRHTMPSVVARREGAGLRSAFAAVHEPYRAVPRLLEIRRLPPAGGPGDAVGILCRGEGFLDYHLFGLAACTCTRIRQPDVTATARYAFVRVRDDRVERMVMVDGTELRYGDLGLTVPESPSGRVIGVQRIEAGAARNALEVDAALAPRPGRSQERVLVEFGDGSTFGLAVREIVREEGRSLIVLDHRPGFDLSDGGTVATHTHHPHREIPGGPRFRLPNVAVWPPS